MKIDEVEIHECKKREKCIYKKARYMSVFCWREISIAFEEAMVPTMESFRKEYKDLIKSTRGMKPKKSNASHSHDAKKPPSQSSPSHFSTEQLSSPFTKTFNYMSQGDHRILCQQNKHLREGIIYYWDFFFQPLDNFFFSVNLHVVDAKISF